MACCIRDNLYQRKEALPLPFEVKVAARNERCVSRRVMLVATKRNRVQMCTHGNPYDHTVHTFPGSRGSAFPEWPIQKTWQHVSNTYRVAYACISHTFQ